MADQAIDPILLHSLPMRLALAERDLAAVYRLLQRHGIPQRRIAALTGQSQSEISEILNGRQVVSYEVLTRVADGLGVPRGWMGLAYDDTTAELVGAAATVEPDTDADGGEADGAGAQRLMTRVAEVAVSAAPVDPHTWRIPLPVSYPQLPRVVTGDDVARLAELTVHLRAVDDRDGGGACRDAVLAHLTWARRLLDATVDGNVETALHIAVSDLFVLAGSACHDVAGYTVPARRHLARAMEHAGYVDEPALVAKAVCHLGMVHLHHGNQPTAVSLLHLGQAAATKSGSGRAAAMVAANLAVAHATSGDERNTLACLSLARDELDRDDTSDVPPWLGFFDHVELHATHATALALLPHLNPSRRAEAIDRIKLALAHRAPALVRARTLDLLTLSTLLFSNDETDDAIRVANQAIDLAARLRSHRVIDRVTKLSATLNHHQDRDDTRALLHRIALLTSTAETRSRGVPAAVASSPVPGG